MTTTTPIVVLLLAASIALPDLPAASALAPAVQDASVAKSQDQPQDQKPSQPQDQKAGQPAAKAETTFKPEQLEQIVAPIALHPDGLLAQILMASTYPLEIVGAYRWLEKNPSVKGGELEEALKKQDWDPAVKSLCGFREVVKQMNDNLDWTQDLGDAFLGQKAEVMETVQKMRKKALDAGNLKSSEQQKVTQEDQVIVVESTKTEVVYVPSYSPTVVYGSSWSYPTYYYPPMYAPPPPGYGFMAFSIGVACGAAVWGGCNWNGNDVNINVNNYNSFNKNTNINGGQNNLPGSGNANWNHNAEHRKGVNYKSPQTAQQFGGTQNQNRVTQDQARGRSSAPGGAAAAGNRAATTPSTGTRPATGADNRPAQSPAARSANKPASSSALSGSSSPSADRSASTRGASSRASSGAGTAGGGGRSGGGGRR